MTEEDTIRIIKRSSFHTVRYAVFDVDETPTMEQFLHKYGWTLAEYTGTIYDRNLMYDVRINREEYVRQAILRSLS